GAVWSKQRENRVYLLFSCGAAAAAVISAFELWMMPAWTVEQYQLLVRWIHVPTWDLTVLVAAMAYKLSSDMARAARLTRELELNEKRFNLAADSANLGMWEWDLEKDEIWVTPTRRAQLGFPPSGRITFEELISRWHADDRDRVRQAMQLLDSARTAQGTSPAQTNPPAQPFARIGEYLCEGAADYSC